MNCIYLKIKYQTLNLHYITDAQLDKYADLKEQRSRDRLPESDPAKRYEENKDLYGGECGARYVGPGRLNEEMIRKISEQTVQQIQANKAKEQAMPKPWGTKVRGSLNRASCNVM